MCADECYEVLLHCAAVEAAEDDVLIAQGEHDPSIYILLKGQMTVYCDHKLLEVIHRSNEEELETSSVAVSSGKSDGDGGGDNVLSLLKSASSKAGDEENMNSRRRSALLEPPSPASRRSSTGQNSAPLLPLSLTAHRKSADNILLVPRALQSRHGSAQLEVPSSGSSFGNVHLDAKISESHRGSAQLELPPSVTCRGKVSTLLQSPTTVRISRKYMNNISISRKYSYSRRRGGAEWASLQINLKF